MSTDRNADGIDETVAVDAERLRSDLERNAEFGAIDAEEGRGRTVLTGTEPNRRARDYLVDRLEDAGLGVSVDAVGNVVGTWTPDSADPDAAPVAAGSHLDSVPEGGIFDGPLGVYAAIEAVRTLQESDVEPTRPVAVVSFTEEEGTRFGGGMLGSSVATGYRSVEDALAATNDEGTTLEDALAEIGYRGEGRLEAGEWDAFLELHVEQDTRLEERGIPVGVVSTITGIVHATARFVGEADHAGTTAMADRTDALAAASEFVLDVERAGREFAMESGTAVATVGQSHVRPNATNVVPGAVELGVDVRDVEAATMDRLLERARRCLARLEADRGVETDLEVELEVEPAPMSERCRGALAAGADAAGVESTSLHSGAAHDAMYVSRVTDAGMLFAPSEDGLSHTPREWTDWEDCATATRVLAGAIARLAGE
ncbi:N-carbamoyl-L-amino-acid hydrolase [Halobiforma haloterrestris]|uniref:N-carbamoyl-L-amino-acid hydrolase n=1 Tax=Natronobacterium haloterrestre TaxID=148448 RepID=A0A1I1GIF5_NATHA|nr:Zn-dependent hydrolase [Halobiforma haloterrestris]SFC11577.1 N-carbamoyl-L-amino-acid hydrolase [Halobiforma haloterrestris]